MPYADDVAVNIKAESLKYDDQKGIIFASGGVSASFLDVTLFADRMLVDTSTNIATAEGRILLKRASYEATGQKVVYDFKSDTAFMEGFSAAAEPQELKGKVFLSAGKVKDTEDVKTGDDTTATTCDLEGPHYTIKGRSFYFKPGDKLVAYSVTAYLGKVPFMWTPCYIYDLSKRRVSMLVPVIGNNSVEGDFIKTETQYFLSPLSYGSVYVDMTSKKGTGYGVEHNYGISETLAGKAYLYRMKEADTGNDDIVVKLEDKFRPDPNSLLGLKYGYSRIYMLPSGRVDRSESSLAYDSQRSGSAVSTVLNNSSDSITGFRDMGANIGLRSGDTSGSYVYGYRGSRLGTKWENVSHGLNYSGKLSPSTTISAVANYYRSVSSEGHPVDERFEPTVTLAHRGPNYLLSLTESTFIDPDGDTYLADRNVEFVEKIPEISLLFDPVEAASVSIRTNAGYARFHESKFIPGSATKRDFVTGRYNLGVNAEKKLPIGSVTEITLSAGAEQFSYGTDDQRYTQRQAVTVDTGAGWLRNRAVYDRSLGEGNSPFYFDSKGYYYNTLKDTITLSKGSEHSFSVEGGYNYATNKYFDLLLRYSSRPASGISFDSASGFDVENGRWRDLSTVVGLAAAWGMKESISHTMDLNNGRTKYASNLLELEAGDRWENRFSLRLGHTFDPVTGSFIMQDAELVKDLHCWEAKYSWSEFRREWRLTFTLKAYPDMPIGYSSGNGGFFVEGLQKESVVRY